MRLSMENKNTYIRRAVFAGLILFTALLQNTKGLFPEIFGVRAMLLIPAVVCVSMYERDIPGIFFGLFAGMLWDTVSAGPHNFSALILTATGFICGALVGSVMRNNLVTALLLTSAAVLVYNTFYWLTVYVLNYDRGEWVIVEGAFRAYYAFYLPSCVYTAVLIPAFYFLVRAVKNKFR